MRWLKTSLAYLLPIPAPDVVAIETAFTAVQWMLVGPLTALVLGARWVAARAGRLDAEHLMVPPSSRRADRVDVALIRRAIRGERKLRVAYEDGAGVRSDRVIWPFLLAFFDGARIVSAWCELRAGIRHFRTDRFVRLDDTGQRYPTPRHELERLWRETEGIATPAGL